MRKVLIFTALVLCCVGVAGAATRDAAGTSRGATGGRTTTASSATNSRGTAARVTSTPTTTKSRTATQSRAATVSRGALPYSPVIPSAISGRTTSTAARVTSGTIPAQTVVSRAAANPVSMAETQTGAEYERCKSAYFTCMDQFCSLKNDDYRRCSCSDRVKSLGDKRAVLQEAGQQLTVFTENLDVVGMTAAQASAMRNASEGENALTSDTSASKALLQAIMNSIRGGDSNVGGKYSDLNSISISFDTVNAFGINNSGQLVASYDGRNLYDAVYPQCRSAVREDCNDKSLQRAITAYLMAIEQDCNTVQTAIEETQSQMKAAVREGSAMLDLARVENRQKHNSDDIATCLANVESAILSEEVCGANYHRCLDNGEFIDKTTGAPIAGVVKFYELAKLLSFSDGVDAANQKLSQITANRIFVQTFEKRTKKFAEPALDKCTEQADVVWAEYLDKAMLDIYYAQRAKVAEIKQGCFDFISSCYMNGDDAMTSAMQELIGESAVLLQPYQVAVTGQLCRDYVQSCNNMFDGNIIAQYIENRQDTDTLTACRAVAQQCFDKYGGTNYENFYYPYSGLFSRGAAPDWFTLYEITRTKDPKTGAIIETRELKSECAKQLAKIDVCNQGDMLEQAFGGLDSINTRKDVNTSNSYNTTYPFGDGTNKDEKRRYGMLNRDSKPLPTLTLRQLRPTGIATEVYNQVIDVLSTQCKNIEGRFVELQFVKEGLYSADNICVADFYSGNDAYSKNGMAAAFGVGAEENMCPRDYTLQVDTESWGACICWENGGRRSKNGLSPTCMAAIPLNPATNKADKPVDRKCKATETATQVTPDTGLDDWCTVTPTDLNMVCPPGYDQDTNGKCDDNNEGWKESLPDGIIF